VSEKASRWESQAIDFDTSLVWKNETSIEPNWSAVSGASIYRAALSRSANFGRIPLKKSFYMALVLWLSD
jgi:hypothetical protein